MDQPTVLTFLQPCVVDFLIASNVVLGVGGGEAFEEKCQFPVGAYQIGQSTVPEKAAE